MESNNHGQQKPIETPQSEAALTIGAYRSFDTGVTDIFAYLRSHEDSRILVVLNFGGTDHHLNLSTMGDKGKVLLSTEMSGVRSMALASLELQPNEGLILRLI